jgi:hypothetical protein
MSKELQSYLTNQVIQLHDLARKTGEEKYRDMADELSDMLNGVLEIRGTIS